MMQNPSRPNLPIGMPASVGSANPKKQRELYIGNVPTGAVNEPMMKELFSQILQQCEGYKAELGAPVLNVQVRVGNSASGNGSGTTYAFVEFRDEETAATIAAFNGMELYGRCVRAGRVHAPSGSRGLRARTGRFPSLSASQHLARSRRRFAPQTSGLARLPCSTLRCSVLPALYMPTLYMPTLLPIANPLLPLRSFVLLLLQQPEDLSSQRLRTSRRWRWPSASRHPRGDYEALRPRQL